MSERRMFEKTCPQCGAAVTVNYIEREYSTAWAQDVELILPDVHEFVCPVCWAFMEPLRQQSPSINLKEAYDIVLQLMRCKNSRSGN